MASGVGAIYRMGRTAASDSSYWLGLPADADVARGFIATDTSERTYWTGDGVPKWTDNTVGLAAPPYPSVPGIRLLGVPAPSSLPTLTETVAGTGDDEARAYVVVWRNDKGEISAPSTAVTITCKPGATIRVTRNATIPSGNYGITHWQVYRTVAGTSADYFFVAEVTAATSFVDDTGTVNSQDPLLSETWEMPPSDLRGLKALWGGMMAGFVGKALYFSEPFRPFAWPGDYKLIFDDDIVALGRWRQQLIVLTVGKPYVVTGSAPEAMSSTLVDLAQACVAKRGVVEFGHGVAWPSPDGLAYLGDGGARVLTEGIALRPDWQAMAPTTMIGAALEGAYCASYDPGTGRKSVMLDPINPLGFYPCEVGFTGAYWDPIADSLFILVGTNVQKWDVGSALTAMHESRDERLGAPVSFGHLQVVADSYPVTITVWANGSPVVTGMPVANGRSVRLPGPARADKWRVKVQTTGAVQGVMLATSAEELRGA